MPIIGCCCRIYWENDRIRRQVNTSRAKNSNHSKANYSRQLWGKVGKIECWKCVPLKVRQSRNEFFQFKKWTNESGPGWLVFVCFWKKLKIPKICFEINWPLKIFYNFFWSFVYSNNKKDTKWIPDHRLSKFDRSVVATLKPISDFQSQFSMPKIIRIFLNFFFHWRISI